MREVEAKAVKARKDMDIEAVAMFGNVSFFPQLNCQSSIRIVADEEADIRR